MSFIKNIFLFFRKLFNKEDSIKMIEAPVETTIKEDKLDFINSLKINRVEKRKKNNVETQTCVGDGLGIQTKISF